MDIIQPNKYSSNYLQSFFDPAPTLIKFSDAINQLGLYLLKLEFGSFSKFEFVIHWSFTQILKQLEKTVR